MQESSYKIALLPGSAYMDAFKYSKDPLWQVPNYIHIQIRTLQL